MKQDAAWESGKTAFPSLIFAQNQRFFKRTGSLLTLTVMRRFNFHREEINNALPTKGYRA
jgi:hypothetical protein